MPSTANLAIYQGDDYAAVVTVSGGGGTTDLTGFVPKAQIRLGPADYAPSVVVEISAQLDPVLTNLINLAIPHTITQQLSGQYAWDLQLIDPGGTITTILAGSVIVTREVTRE